ncbi:hypothetical protein C5N14_30835 [Micromonospora sp. MW-13]|uniref:hypothetical protein n=1 Tax=Micromonospora sp. MW-13 TaxID=2094022 RepID=UPI000E434597|nr:hypothetical protein [Micromonospora sp. MW-13]RGC64989.1 hypothetical protein C5N14_30835 [Micromonospora sp. MW-13]
MTSMSEYRWAETDGTPVPPAPPGYAQMLVRLDNLSRRMHRRVTDLYGRYRHGQLSRMHLVDEVDRAHREYGRDRRTLVEDVADGIMPPAVKVGDYDSGYRDGRVDALSDVARILQALTDDRPSTRDVKAWVSDRLGKALAMHTTRPAAPTDVVPRCAYPGDQEHDHEMCNDVVAEANGQG